MGSTMHLSLTDELKKFIQQNSGDGTLFSTPSEFIRDALRERKDQMEATVLREGILEGYQDLMQGHYVEYKGSIRQTIAEVKNYDKVGWPQAENSNRR